MKTCVGCDEEKPLEDFYADKNRADGLFPRCRECEKARKRKFYAENRVKALAGRNRWVAENPEARSRSERRSRIQRYYGISVEEYDEIRARGCAICGTQEGRICLDHCHTTGKVRDALCVACNLAIGNLRDDPRLADAAARYLRTHA